MTVFGKVLVILLRRKVCCGNLRGWSEFSSSRVLASEDPGCELTCGQVVEGITFPALVNNYVAGETWRFVIPLKLLVASNIQRCLGLVVGALSNETLQTQTEMVEMAAFDSRPLCFSLIPLSFTIRNRCGGMCFL
jgi:hypothetical protein